MASAADSGLPSGFGPDGFPIWCSLLISTPYLVGRDEPAYYDDGSFASVRAPDAVPCFPVLLGSGIARARYGASSGSVTTVSTELADRLGLGRSRPAWAGGAEMLDQPLELRLIGRNSSVLLHYIEMLVWVQQGLHATGADMQIGKLAGSCMPGGPDLLTCLTLQAAGRPPLQLPRLAPLLTPRSTGSSAADGSGSFQVDPAAMQQAMQLVHARRAARPASLTHQRCPCCSSPVWLRDPGALLPPLAPHPPASPPPPLTYLLHPDPVTFDDGSMDRHHQQPRVPARVAGAPGIVRTCYNPSAPVATVSLELAERLGLRRRRMPGAGISGLACGQAVSVEVLLDPLDVQLLDRSGTVLLQYTELVVFVQQHVLHALGADLQIGQLLDSCTMGSPDRSVLWTLASEGRPPLHLPRLGPLPSRFDRPAVVGTSTFTVDPETLELAVRLASVRREVLARRAAAAASPAGAAEQAPSGDLWLREPGELLPPPGPAASAPLCQTPAAPSTPPAPAVVLVPGSAEWMAEWLPASMSRGRGRQQRSGRRGRGRQGRGGGRASSGRGRRQPAAQDHAGEAGEDGDADDVGGEAPPPLAAGGSAGEAPGPIPPPPAAEAGAEAEAGAAAGGEAPLGPECDGLAPLPDHLAPALWSELQASTLGEGADCSICYEILGSRGSGLCVQLPCRHSYCLLCLRTWLHQKLGLRELPFCPYCMAEIAY